MDARKAEQTMLRGISDAWAFLSIANDQPKMSPLWREMRQAALDALDWANDDTVIDALYEADVRDRNNSG